MQLSHLENLDHLIHQYLNIIKGTKKLAGLDFVTSIEPLIPAM